MSSAWPPASYEEWRATCDTLHAHSQVLGKLAVRLAPPGPQLQNGALRLTARGWETAPLPAPDGSGSLVVALDLRVHEAVVEHSGGQAERVPLAPDRPVAEVTREVLAAVRRVAGAVDINPRPQEVPWSVPLDEDYEHARYDPGWAGAYFAAATQAALVLAAFRAPYRGRSTRRPATSSRATAGTPSWSRPAGGPGIRVTRRRPSSPSPTRRRRGSRAPACPRPLAGGMRAWASTSWTGTTSARPLTRVRWRSSSPGRCSATPARCADGIQRWPAAPREGPRPSGNRASAVVFIAAGRRAGSGRPSPGRGVRKPAGRPRPGPRTTGRAAAVRPGPR